MKKITTITITSSLLFSALAFGGGTHSEHHQASNHEDRTLAITMHDNMRYNLKNLDVKQGETIRFQITNKGRIPHEFTIGSKDVVLAHKKMMESMPGMIHDEPNSITLNPGESGEIIWTFDEFDQLEAACLIPGHYEAGMRMQFIQKDF